MNGESADARVAGKRPGQIESRVAELVSLYNFNAEEQAFFAIFLRDNPDLSDDDERFAALSTVIGSSVTNTEGVNDMLTPTLRDEGWMVSKEALTALNPAAAGQ